MKVVQIVADGSPGGGTTFVLSLCGYLREHNIDVELITQKKSYAKSYAEEAGFRVYGLDFFNYRAALRTVKDITEVLAKTKPDLFHVHGSRAGFYMSCTRGNWDADSVYTVHGYHFRHRRVPWRHLWVLAEKRISSTLDLTCFVSETDKKIAHRYGILTRCDRTRVIKNGIYGQRFPRPSSQKNGKCLGFLGRLTHQKDPELFVEIVARLAPYGYRGLMIGGGELENKIKQLGKIRGLSDMLEVTGSLSHEEALKKLYEVDVLVMPSRWEGLPLAPLEAMYIRVPVVAAAVDGMVEIIQDGRDGFLVGGRDAALYAERVRKLEDNRLKERIVTRARKKVLEHFLFEGAGKQYVEVYEELLSSTNFRR